MPSPAINFMRGGTDLFSVLLALSATRSVFTADLYVIDGGTGRMRAAADHNDGAHWLEQSDTTKQCALPAPHADYDGQLCATFDHTVPNWYTSNRAASAWPYIHSGLGHRVSFCMTPTVLLAGVVYWGTYTGGAQTGAWQSSQADTTSARWLVFNESGGGAIDASIAAAYTLNVARYYQIRFTDNASPEYQVYVNGTAGASGSSLTHSSKAPQSPLVLGRRANTTAPVSMRFRDWISGPDTTEFADAIAAYQLATNGLAA